MRMVKKKFWVLIVLASFLLGIGWWVRGREAIPVKKELIEEKELGEVELVLDFGEGEVGTYSVSICSSCSPTVFEVLSQAAKENELILAANESEFGVFVKEIGGRANSKDEFWLYYVNGKMGEIAADKYQLKEGDKLEWRYAKQF